MATPLSSTIQRDGSANSFQGRRLNRPNDVVVKSDGAIYLPVPRPQRPGGICDLGILRKRLKKNTKQCSRHGKTQTQKTHAAISANPSRQLYGDGRLLADLELRDLVSMHFVWAIGKPKGTG